MTSAWEKYQRKPVDEWTLSDRLKAMAAAGVMGFLSVEIVAVALWMTRGLSFPLGEGFHLWAVVMAVVLAGAVALKIRARKHEQKRREDFGKEKRTEPRTFEKPG